MKITFLGTSSMLPTQTRNPSAILFSHDSENILVDCGEGTQKQFRIKGISPCKITRLLITHWHGDHILGIPGLLQSLGAYSYNKTLDIYGPKGTKEFFKNMFRSFVFPLRIDLKINEITKEGNILNNSNIEVEAFKVEHVAPCLGYIIKEKDRIKINLDYLKKFNLERHPILGELQRGKDIVWEGKKISFKKATYVKKGKRVAVILDSAYNSKLIKQVKDVDVLVCESVWLHKDKTKTRKDYAHLSAKEAAMIAKKAKVGKLILTHFSQIYPNTYEIEKEAKSVFKNSVCSKDFDEFIVN